MKTVFFGDFNQAYIKKALITVRSLVKFQKDIEFYFSEHMHYCNLVLKKLPKEAYESFANAMRHKVSFSYKYGRRKIIVIYIPKNKRYLLKNEKALVGILLHEVIHITQMYGLYVKIKRNYRKYYLSKVNKLKISDKKKKVLYKIGINTVLLLKDLYVNTVLEKEEISKYLLEYFYYDLSFKKTCPRPVFYDKLKKAVKKNPEILAIVLEFEFALLSVLLPFYKFKGDKAKEIVYHIKNCYSVNLQDLLRKLSDIISVYEMEFDESSEFQKKFFETVLNKSLKILN